MAGDFVFMSVTLNGETREFHVRPDEMLIDVIRDRFALTGTKLSCDVATCGACTVQVDGKPAASCATYAWQANGADIRTIEGLRSDDGVLDPVQRAFVENSAFQCGFCTPGMIMLARALLDQNPAPDRTTIQNWMDANICRCTGYEMILEAVQNAAALQREDAQ